MKYDNKTGATYIANPDTPVGLLPTKNGYEQFTIRPAKMDLSWVALNNKIRKRASGNS